MLGAIFRGVFLIGILTWYSTSVWKMIDGYFRDQFRSYLEEEYKKNPRMRSDVQSTGKADSVVTTEQPETTTPLREIMEACQPDDVCAVEVAENDSVSNEPGDRNEVTGGTSENQAAVEESIDKNAFLKTVAEAELESRKPADNEEPINHVRDLEKGKIKVVDQSAVPTPRNPPKKTTKIGKKSTVERNLPKKRKVNTIMLTDQDFQLATSNTRDVSDDDFWEFEEDADEREPLQGILVSKLPFKPRADIGDLERVTADEYCPLTLEDEASCGETVKWP